ncbi:hypothetical protein, partial [Nocardia pseudovaccinii]|uniref:hypothetical protein n=1 Tax=Nocardia pseudovaccinii TaxID=189540 RepID=UPI000A4212B7
FLDWVAPEQMESQVRKFLTDTIPGIAEYSTDAWWKKPLLTSILEATKELFGDLDGFTAPENHDPADQFVRFLGECYVRRHPDTTWTNRPEWGDPLYVDIGPAVQVRGTSVQSVVSKAEALFRRNYGPDMVEYIISKAHLPA